MMSPLLRLPAAVCEINANALSSRHRVLAAGKRVICTAGTDNFGRTQYFLLKQDARTFSVACLDERHDSEFPSRLNERNSEYTAPICYIFHCLSNGVTITAILVTVLTCTFLSIDACMIRHPHAAFPLTTPFLVSLIATGLLGRVCVPILAKLKAQQVFRKEGPAAHASKTGTPTMGGIFMVPVGVAVARVAVRSSSAELVGVATATILFAAIGLLDDASSIFRKHNYGVPGWIKLILEMAGGIWFYFSFCTMKNVVPLPAQATGSLHIGSWYLPLTAFCFASMANGVNLTDGLDGLASGSVALAFAAMAVSVLPISPGLGVFGASMAGACAGFLLHNRHKASVFMGDTGSIALGGALAAMASCTGFFLPLFIASGIFVIETISVILQVSYFKYTKRVNGTGKRLLKMAPFHHHLEHLGFKETHIVAGAYLCSLLLALVAAHVGLISVPAVGRVSQ